MIKDLREALDSKKIGAVELLDSYIKKIEENKNLNCFITVDRDFSVSQAKAAQKLIDENRAGLFTGIPVAVKDNIITKGMKTTCASKMLSSFVPDFNATVTDKLECSSYTLLGKTNMDEFAMGNSSENSYFGAVKNPVNQNFVPGGSSGGSAAAIAKNLAPVALGSDTGGSVRQPAAFCGCFGLKPTYGRVSRFGLISFASSLEQIGIFSHTASDALLMLNAISGRDEKDLTSTDSKAAELKDVSRKIGLPKEFFDFSDPKIADMVENAAKEFEKLGFFVEYCSLSSLKYSVPAYYIISSAEAASNLARFDGVKYGFSKSGESFEEIIKNSRSGGFGKEVKRRIMLGNYCLAEGFYDKYYIKAQAVREKLKAEFSELFKTYDFLITPTTPALPNRIGESLTPSQNYSADILTVPQNLTGLPSVSVPCGEISKLPVGMSITGNYFCESGIISLADIFERRCGI